MTASNVSFLNSGRLLHTIFPKSQCWCVDGESKFVLRIRQDSYYRMELPYDTEEDKAKVEDFKISLGKVLQYEKTPCPFKRGFEVVIPEQKEITPVRSHSRKPAEKAKKWLFDKNWVPEDGPMPSMDLEESATSSSYENGDRQDVQTGDGAMKRAARPSTSQRQESPVLSMKNLAMSPPRLSVSQRAKTFSVSRSATAPPQVSFGQSPPSNARRVYGHLQIPKEESEAEAELEEPVAEAISRKSSVDSFYSMAMSQSRSDSRSVTPPFEDAVLPLDSNPWVSSVEHLSVHEPVKDDSEWQRGRHRRQISDLTVTAYSRDHTEVGLPSSPTVIGENGSAPSTPPLMSDSEDSSESPMLDVQTPPDAIRMRKLTGASQRRAYSPMPHPKNLFNPASQAPRNQLSATIVQKTCQILFGPPANLVAMMLRIAAQITNGIFRFNTYRVPRQAERIPCSWDSSSGDDDDWAEDDFGIPLGHLDASGLRMRSPGQGRGWELD